jgi:hypothetical protein
VDRISFNNLEVGHLSQQQVVASDDPRQGCDFVLEFSSSISTAFGEVVSTAAIIHLILRELSGVKRTATTCTFGKGSGPTLTLNVLAVGKQTCTDRNRGLPQVPPSK